MRQVGSISTQNLAKRFGDYLRAGGTSCSIEKSGDEYLIWVHDDDRVAAARDELPRFLARPDDQKYLDARQLAREVLDKKVGQKLAARRMTVNLSEKWRRPTSERCPLTFGLIVFSGIVGYLTGLHPHADPRTDWLWFSTDGTISPILHGDVWRLITPIFLHFGLMHLLFNMLWLQQFGMQIEFRKGSAKYLGMVVVIASLSNFAEFLFSGPNFGGMSGVVYGLFGYIWVKGKLEPDSGFFVSQQTVLLMVGWYIVCMLGVVQSVANWAHGVGLITGIAFGFSDSLWKSFKRTR